MAGRAAQTFVNVVPYLSGQAPKPKLPEGYSYEFTPSSSGGSFTGNIVKNPPKESFNALKSFLSLVPAVALAPFTGGSSLTGVLGTVKSALQANATPILPPQIVGRISPMGFADGDSGFFGSLPSLGDVTKIFQGGFGQQLLGIGTNALSQYVNSQFQPPTIGPAMMAAAPAIARGAGAVATVGRGFFNRFPNLATAIQGYRNMGKKVTRGKLYGLMKRFGPDFLISGGILTAAAVSELAVAGPGRRRMNPGNVHALRRAHRRMKSFHKVCQINDTLLTHRRRSSKRSEPLGRSIVQVK
jgi:hypothetical protein